MTHISNFSRQQFTFLVSYKKLFILLLNIFLTLEADKIFNICFFFNSLSIWLILVQLMSSSLDRKLWVFVVSSFSLIHPSYIFSTTSFLIRFLFWEPGCQGFPFKLIFLNDIFIFDKYNFSLTISANILTVLII